MNGEGSNTSSSACSLLDSNCYVHLMGQTSPMELSVSSAVNEQQQQEQIYQPLKVYLRVRPFSKMELESNESQGCVTVENSETVTLQAPKESFTMKNSERGIGESVHQFTFTKVFGPETTQSEFFEGTMKDIVKSYIDGANGLVFTYGVTNAGKTFTIQGSPKDGGILPRSLDMIFHHIRRRQYLKMNFRPYLSNDVKKLDETQVKQEETIKASVLAALKEDLEDTSKHIVQNASLYNLECESSDICSSTCLLSEPRVEDPVFLDAGGIKHQRMQSAVWVSFFEIYNEYVYDLLDVLAMSKNQKRKVLRICEDQGGNSYVKDLKWINVQSTEEACRILKIGNKNRSLACTRLNQHSSRSHSIYSIRLLRLTVEDEPRILGVSEMSLCDLAGSERCNKTQTFGDRLKEAGNINNSLFILGKCMAALKQNLKVKPSYIPFRESKLTRLFQPFFCGKGKACMIVNINQCASTHNETLHVMKFSAIAKQVIQAVHPQTFEYFAPRLIGKEGRPVLHFDASISAEELPDEDLDSSSEEEVDITIMTHEELLKTTENLKEKLVMERKSKLLLEVQIRKEMAEAMFQQLLETEETCSKRLEDMRESYEEKLENKFEMYKEAIKKHAYMCAMEQVEDHYVPIEEFIAEQEKVEDRDRRISELQQKLGEQSNGLLALGIPNSENKVQPDLNYKEMQRTTEVLQRQCGERDELIKSLKFKIQKLNETLQEANEVCRKTVEENNRLRHMVTLQEQEMRGLQNCAKHFQELEATVSLLQEQLDESKKHLHSENLKEQKPKRGLFANIKSTVAGTSKTPIGKTLGKSENPPTMSRKQATSARKIKE
ncbi:kinesin-like protein KIF20A [Carettochelys insculpta]|uniref:kinesin-like protein KIF20A n=1 Tax=Carettochelys insculpta TaxID=44489 RepID=UPI003EBF9E81